MKDLRLPEDFVFRMRDLLKEEYRAFIDSYEDDRVQGLRVNSLKIGVDKFKRISPFSIESVPWSENGFYYSSDERPGRHPYHEAGLYYIQEPSAMAVGELVDPKPGEKVLDLCASPGGKTTHMASKMEQRGLLVSNEINATRARVLAQNVKRMGIRNAVVTNEPPDRLVSKFEGFFDRILVDAPCSGEGMFRKDPQACDEWSLQRVEMCAQRQLDILGHAQKMLKSGGRLVYSTCTFSPEEDEGTVNEFLKANTSFEVEQAQFFKGFGQFPLRGIVYKRIYQSGGYCQKNDDGGNTDTDDAPLAALFRFHVLIFKIHSFLPLPAPAGFLFSLLPVPFSRCGWNKFYHTIPDPLLRGLPE